MVWGAHAVIMVPEPKDFDKGLIFVKDTDILLSGDKWTILVNIALNDYDALIENMKSVLYTVRQKIQVHKNPKIFSFDIYWGEIDRLDRMVGILELDVISFQKLLYKETRVRDPQVAVARNKRGLINILGYGLKYLFGTADAKDVKRLTRVCDDLHEFKAKMTHAAEQQLTYIRTLDEVTRHNVRNTIELTRALRDSIRNTSLKLNRVEADLLDTQEAISKQVKFSAAIREIEMAILDLRFSITQIQESLDVTSNGKLSSVLINPYNLSEILQQVSLQLPAGLSMLTGLTVEDMYVYYAIATVHAVATSESIRLIIDIPLKATDRYFELYQVHSLPFFHKEIGRYVMIDEAFTYLAVAESRQFFAVIPPYMLSRCTQDLYTVCPADMMLKTAGGRSCLPALFLGKADVALAKCKRLIIHENFEPVWIRSPDSSYWIYSLSTPQRITAQCQEIGSPPQVKMSQQLMLNGTGILLNSSSCYVHAENFRLLPHSVGRSTVNLAEARIVLPSIDKILNSLEEDLFQADAHHPEVDLQHLDGLVERASSGSQMQGIDINKMVTTLHSRTVNRPTPHWVWIIIVIVTSMACGAIWPIWVKLFSKCCPRIRKCVTRILQPPPTSNDVELHDCEIGLQVNLENETSGGQINTMAEGSAPLQGFVQHGVLTVEP